MTFATIPEGLDLITGPTETIIRRTWLSWKLIPLVFFAIFWDGFLFFWYSTALSKPGTPLVAILFPLLHVAVGVGLTYYVIASLANKTDIILSRSTIEVKTGPFPWIGNKKILANSILHVVVRERSGRSNRQITYNVMVAGQDRKERSFVSWISNKEQAEFIAAKIREATHIQEDATH